LFCIEIIYRNKIIYNALYIIYLIKKQIIEKNFKILKSRIAFEKWTFLKMSKMRNLEIVLKITFQVYNCDEDAVNFVKIVLKMCLYFSGIFQKNGISRIQKKCQKMPNKLW
jgi:hypothetical protein